MRLSDLGWVPRAVAALLVLLGLGAGLAVVLVARSIAVLDADAETRATAANVAPPIAAALRKTVEDTTAVAQSGATQQQPLPFDEAEEGGVPFRTAVRVRDTGRALLDESGIAVAATYTSPQPPKSVAERRATVSGLYVVPLEVEPLIARLRPSEGGILLEGADRTVAATPGEVPSGATMRSVAVAQTLASGWKVTVWSPPVGVPPGAWALAAALVLLGVAAAALLLRREARAAAVSQELGRLQVQSSTVSDLAAVAQRSLDLADVLPAVATQLTTALGLRGLALTSYSPEGERPLFATGEAPGEPPEQGLPATVVAGQTVSQLLSRGGRAVARLQVVAGRDLDSHEVVTLSAVAEILSSALTNAETFAKQRELLQRLRAVDELKTVFLATASHELRTPVGVISGFARLLSGKVEKLTPDQIRLYAERVDTNAQQLASLVENLLDFSRLERGKGVDGEQGVLDLGETVCRILDQQPDLVADHVVTRQAPGGLLVSGTEHAVERVLTNLVGNAGKYSPAGTAIRVQVRGGRDRVELLVDDEGAGVPAQDREQIFSRFFRGRGDAVVNTRGAGLGLAIVREFAATMSGVVSVTSAPTGGARFVVSYPVAEPARASQDESPGESDVAS